MLNTPTFDRFHSLTDVTDRAITRVNKCVHTTSHESILN